MITGEDKVLGTIPSDLQFFKIAGLDVLVPSNVQESLHTPRSDAGNPEQLLAAGGIDIDGKAMSIGKSPGKFWINVEGEVLIGFGNQL